MRKDDVDCVVRWNVSFRSRKWKGKEDGKDRVKTATHGQAHRDAGDLIAWSRGPIVVPVLVQLESVQQWRRSGLVRVLGLGH